MTLQFFQNDFIGFYRTQQERQRQIAKSENLPKHFALLFILQFKRTNTSEELHFHRKYIPYQLSEMASDGNFLQILAIPKRALANIGYTVRNDHAFQSLTVHKCPFVNLRYVIGNDDLLQAFTS